MEYMLTEGSGSSWEDGSDSGSSEESGCHMEFEGEVPEHQGFEEYGEDFGFYYPTSETGYSSHDQVSVFSDHAVGEEVSVQVCQFDHVLQEASTEGESVSEGPRNPSKHKCDYPLHWIRSDGCVYPKFRTRARKFLAFHRSLYHLQRGDEYWIHDDEKHVRPVYPHGLPWVSVTKANVTHCRFSQN